MQFEGPTLISVLKISLPHFSFESAVYFLQFLKNKELAPVSSLQKNTGYRTA
jgi:hypothetical protein